MFEQVDYASLNGKQQEIYNFQKIAGVLADYGFNCIKLADDWQGADFLAYHKDGRDTLRVQLKGRMFIGKNYLGKAIWMAFPHKQEWFLVPHDVLVDLVEQNTNWLQTSSWIDKGVYHTRSPSAEMLKAMEDYRVRPIKQALEG
jgi:hypothetical protein